ncbi:MAG TPA: hypothetical protein VNW92_30135 [Polyangiaceae bacterium]|nr:hypothetical protein [Polyangiaceae bacterium]
MTPMFLCKLLPGAVLIGFLSAAACLPACSSDNTANQSDPLSADVVREGQTTTLALDQFLRTTGDDWGWAGGTFDTPADGAVLPAATPTAFTWHADPTSGPNPNDTIVASKQNGQAFMLVFSSSSDPKLLRVFTSLTSYTPDAKAWQKLVAAGGPISVNVTSATFENDLLTSDGGPHIGQTISITLQ